MCGSVPFETWLPEPDAAIVLTALDALATPTGPDDRRPVGWRRADALVELCRSALDGGLPAAANGVRPHLTLLADATDWHAGRTVTLAGVAGLPAVEIHPETARELTCDAGVSIGGHAGGRLGRLEDERRFPGPALRRRLEARDQGCRFPGCSRAARRCHAHHVRHWSHGGATVEVNLLLLCARGTTTPSTTAAGRWPSTAGPRRGPTRTAAGTSTARRSARHPTGTATGPQTPASRGA